MDPYLKTLDLSSQEYFLRDLWQVILKASSQVSGPGSSTIQVSSDFFFFRFFFIFKITYLVFLDKWIIRMSVKSLMLKNLGIVQLKSPNWVWNAKMEGLGKRSNYGEISNTLSVCLNYNNFF